MAASVVQLVVLLSLHPAAQTNTVHEHTVTAQLAEHDTDRSITLKVEDAKDRCDLEELGLPSVPIQAMRRALEVADAAPRDAVAMHAGRGPPAT